MSGTTSAIATGWLHSYATQAGTCGVVCWGDNFVGKATPPPEVDGTDGAAVAVAAVGAHSLAIALPDPSATALLGSGVALLGLLARRRARR